MQKVGKRCPIMQEPSSENISQQDSNPSIARLSLQQSHKILIQNRLEIQQGNSDHELLIGRFDGEDSVSEQIRGLGPGSGRPPRVGRLRGWTESSEILALVY